VFGAKRCGISKFDLMNLLTKATSREMIVVCFYGVNDALL
jgi:hypothetical protein